VILLFEVVIPDTNLRFKRGSVYYQDNSDRLTVQWVVYADGEALVQFWKPTTNAIYSLQEVYKPNAEPVLDRAIAKYQVFKCQQQLAAKPMGSLVRTATPDMFA
jgi:hypothetical protein